MGNDKKKNPRVSEQTFQANNLDKLFFLYEFMNDRH